MLQNRNVSVLIVEDSALMRILLTDIISADSEITLLGSARDGKEGVEKAKLLNPDVIISDMIMPEYDGLYLVKRIMKELPLPVILLSALEKTNPLVFEALSLGAFDFLDKPKDNIGNALKAKAYPLIELIKAAAGADVVQSRRIKIKKNNNAHTFDDTAAYSAIIIGASTGGPGAIENLLKQLPANIMLPIIIAQHMPPSFIESFASRLNQISPFEIKVARKGEEIENGTVYLAPGTTNLRLKKNPDTGCVFFSFSEKAYKEFNKPSIDCLMESAAAVYKEQLIAVILTGMGKDGTIGLKAIRDAGGITIAQDETTSVVFGMPKNAWEEGAAQRLIPIDQMGGFIISCF